MEYGRDGGGAMICMPVIFAYPCGCCGNPAQICPTCSGAFCSGCAHGCDGSQGDYNDSPWGSDIETAPPPGETGGSGETVFHQTSTNYADLVLSYLNPNAWTLVEEGLFLRCQTLTELNTCYIHDGEVDDSRRLGSIRDWRRVGDFMAWHHPVIVLVNAVVRKTMVFEVGRAPASRDLTQALRELRANPNWLGFSWRRARTKLSPHGSLVDAGGIQGFGEKMHRAGQAIACRAENEQERFILEALATLTLM